MGPEFSLPPMHFIDLATEASCFLILKPAFREGSLPNYRHLIDASTFVDPFYLIIGGSFMFLRETLDIAFIELLSSAMCMTF
jgi:hypothetical protein